MDLWIRSQNKLKLVKVNFVYAAECGDHFTIYGETIDSSPIIATYKSKERTIEVLDEIQKEMTINETINGTYEEQDLYMKALYIEKSRLIYQMPKE